MSQNNDEVLVRVEGVSKKFCRSLKKSLWYGVCDIASELNPFRGNEAEGARRSEIVDRVGEGTAGGNQLADAGDSQSEWSGSFQGPSSSWLESGPAKTPPDRAPVVPASASSSVLISDISGKKSSPALDARLSTLDSAQGLRPGEFWAVKDVSFELRRGECLGLIGHNGAGNQAAGQPLGRLPQGSPQGEMSGSERINTTLLKMLNGLIKPDHGSITMRGRVASWSMLKTPQANGAHFRSTLDSRHSTPLPINGSVLGLTKKH